MTVAEREFLIQPTLFPDEFDGEVVGLLCDYCGHIQIGYPHWLRPRAGDMMGCPGCGIPARIPSLDP